MTVINTWRSRTSVSVLLLVVAGMATTIPGCGPPGELTMLQPQLQGWQQSIRLFTERVYWAGDPLHGAVMPDDQTVTPEADPLAMPTTRPAEAATSPADVIRVLAKFPLPGAMRGKPMYLLYLRLPDETKEVTFSPERPSVRGFLIQARGRFAGLVDIVEGYIEIEGTSDSRGATRRLELEVDCEDGTRLVGTLLAKRDEWRLEQFETRERTADVARLRRLPMPPPATQPSDDDSGDAEQEARLQQSQASLKVSRQVSQATNER
jgi:hypothetical protein